MTVCTGIAHSDIEKRTNDNFDRNGNRLPFYAYYKPSKNGVNLPENVDDIISICEILSKGIPQVRIDTYVVDGNILFGEMTFYTWSGFIIFSNLNGDREDKWDKWLGDKIKLPNKPS